MTANAEMPVEETVNTPPKKGSLRTLAIVGGIVCLSIFGFLVFQAVAAKGGAESKQQALNNGRTIASAIQQYKKSFGRLPRNVVDEAGSPIQSWRVNLLPLMSQANIHDLIRSNENLPWDSSDHAKPNDVIVTKMVVPGFQSPRGLNAEAPLTHYVCVTDPASPMVQAASQPVGQPIAEADGAENTALFLEYPASDINWAEPRDVSLAEATDIIQQSKTPGTVVGMADGTAVFVPKSATDDDIAKLFLSGNGAPQGSWWTERSK